MNDNTTHTPSGATYGGVRWLLRAEGLVFLLLACAGYAQWGNLSWWWFAALFLLPDLAFFGYAINARIGAMCYNAAHSTIGPAALLTWAVVQGNNTALSLALIWWAHIGFDRALGYGLKYTQGFCFTHLGRIGKKQV